MAQLDPYQLSLLRRLQQSLPVTEYARDEYLKLSRRGYVAATPYGNQIVFRLTDDGREAIAESKPPRASTDRPRKRVHAKAKSTSASPAARSKHGVARDLYEIAERIQKETPRYSRIYFEDGHDESLWFDTYPAKLNVMPHSHGRRLKKGETIADATSFDVGFSWGESDVEMSSYKSPRAAVKRAMELALWGEDDIKEAFGISPYAPY
jgi:hypothetical protein